MMKVVNDQVISTLLWSKKDFRALRFSALWGAWKPHKIISLMFSARKGFHGFSLSVTALTPFLSQAHAILRTNLLGGR